jgi:hypothetical protein
VHGKMAEKQRIGEGGACQEVNRSENKSFRQRSADDELGQRPCASVDCDVDWWSWIRGGGSSSSGSDSHCAQS